MAGQRARVFSYEFKEAAVRRTLAGEKGQALAVEFRLWPKLMYAWRDSYERGGPEALLPVGRPRKSATLVERPEPAASSPRGKGEPPDGWDDSTLGNTASVSQNPISWPPVGNQPVRVSVAAVRKRDPLRQNDF
jgi:transposase-like protein